MTLLEKLDALKQATGDTNATLARKSGIPYTTIDGLYKKGYANMKLSTIQALCDYFNVSLDYLAKDTIENITSDNREKPINADGLSEKEDELIENLKALSPQNRHVLLLIASALLKDQVANPDSRGSENEK